MEEKTKICKHCGKELPLSAFYSEKECYCIECKKKLNNEYNRKKRLKLKTGNPALKDFTPRELMEELRYRGYRGELTYEQHIKI